MPQGRTLTSIIEADLTGRQKQPFRFKVLGEMVPLSRRTAVADLIGIKVAGFLAWFVLENSLSAKAPDPGCPSLSRFGLDGGVVFGAECFRVDSREGKT